MQGKISRLKSILIIGTIILFIAGTSFLSVKSMDSYVKTITMGLIGFVFYYLSYYEEKKLNFKGTSIFTYVFASLSIFFTYATIGFYNYFGKWFSILGEGSLIFLASLLFFIALLLLISSVKYKVYKLIELSIWITIIGISFIICHFNVDFIYILIGLIVLTFIKNVINFNEYSRWVSFALSGFSLIYFDSSNVIPTIILGVVIIINALFILIKNEKEQVIPIFLSYATLYLLSRITNNTIIFISLVSVLEIIMLFTKTIKRNDVSIASKIIVNITYLLLLILPETQDFKYVIPAIVLATSLINIFVSKDSMEEYLLPFKAVYFTSVELNALSLDVFKEYLIIFVANVVTIFLYYLFKRRSVKYVNLTLIGLINLFAISRLYSDVFPNVVYLIMFALDFYVIYVSEEKSKTPLSVLFMIYSFILTFGRMATVEYTFAAYVSFFFIFFLGITRKNKLIFGTSVLGFVLSGAFFFNGLIGDQTVVGSIVNALIIIGIILFQFMCIETKPNKVSFIGVTIGLQIVLNLSYTTNIIFKIFALVEGIALIALSIKDEAYKGLYIEGLIFVVISILNIVGTVASVPKSLYLIIIGLAIVLTTPLIISKYLKIQAEMKVKEEQEAKEREKEEKKNAKKITNNSINFCPECGTKVKSGYIFCSNCGTKIR